MTATAQAVVPGLTEREAARRLAERGRPATQRSSRSYASIIHANTLNVPNAILFVFGVLTIAFGSWRDALFLGILVANIAIGSFQEIRSKRELDRLAALLTLDEANLTGESEPVVRRGDEPVWSGSFAVEGAGVLARIALWGLCAAMLAVFAVALAVPFLRHFYELTTPTGDAVAAWAVGTFAGVGGMLGVLALVGDRPRHLAPSEV